MRLRLLLFFVFVVSITAQAQSWSVTASDRLGLGSRLDAYYYRSGEESTGAHLALGYSIPIKDLFLKDDEKTRLEQKVMAMFPDLFGNSGFSSDSETAIGLVKTVPIFFELSRGKVVYARCTVPKNYYGYGFSAASSTVGAFEPYVSVGSSTLYINKKAYYGQTQPFRICKDGKNQRFIDPVVKIGDAISLKQKTKVVLKGRFRAVPY